MFQFESAAIDWNSNAFGKFDPLPLDFVKLKEIFSHWQKDLYNKSWNALFWENHDLARSVSRFGDDRFYWQESAKALAIMLMLMQGTPFIYQGEEIGMTNCYFRKLEDYQDVDSFGRYQELVIDKKLISEYNFIQGLAKGSRDNARSPMQWDDSVNAGFNTGAKTWLKVTPNYKTINVKQQINDKDSILWTYKNLISLRKNPKYHDTIRFGSYEQYLPEDKNFYLYSRKYNNQELLVVINFSREENILNFKEKKVKEILISNYKDSPLNLENVSLRPYEAIVYLLQD